MLIRVFYHLLSCSVDLSPGLVDVLSRMMHHDPKLRPTVDELLADPCVVLAGYQHCCYKAYTWTFSTCKYLLGRVLGFFVLLLSIIPGESVGGKWGARH